ncbi:MAG: DUF1552 domain-containing protein [Chitinophagaceae bacterium]|nr:DUF1552 domain-containing protein [Oligoflexus sp.]
MLTRAGLSRRNLFRGATSALLYYPLMRALSPNEAFAQSTTNPRVIFVSFPGGTYTNKFWPEGSVAGPIGTLPFVTSPLEVHKSDMILYQGYNLIGATNHNGSMPQVLAGWGACSAGSPVQCGKNPGFPNNDGTTTQNMDAVPYSIDQRLADTLGAKSSRPSINMGIQTHASGNPFPEPISWKKDGTPNFPNDNPQATYTDIFGNFIVPTGGTTTQTTAQTAVSTGKKRIVDYLIGDINRIKLALGSHEKAAFDAHLSALDEINRDINNAMTPAASTATIGSQCNPKSIQALLPTDLSNQWYMQAKNAPAVFKLQRAIMVQAMACDITRVGVWQMGCSHQESHMPAEGVVDDPGTVLHLLAHTDNQFYANNQQGQMREIANMVAEMKKVSMGDHTLFDETLVYVATDIGDSATAHGGDNIAAFMLGSLGGKIKTGRIVDGKGAGYNHLLVTVAQLMGLTSVATIGNTSQVGPVKDVIG